MANKFEQSSEYSISDIEKVLRVGDTLAISKMVIGVALYHNDVDYASGICADLSNNSDEIVRGNAILGFGHLARRFGRLDKAFVLPIVRAGLVDQSEYVRAKPRLLLMM